MDPLTVLQWIARGVCVYQNHKAEQQKAQEIAKQPAPKKLSTSQQQYTSKTDYPPAKHNIAIFGMPKSGKTAYFNVCMNLFRNDVTREFSGDMQPKIEYKTAYTENMLNKFTIYTCNGAYDEIFKHNENDIHVVDIERTTPHYEHQLYEVCFEDTDMPTGITWRILHTSASGVALLISADAIVRGDEDQQAKHLMGFLREISRKDANWLRNFRLAIVVTKGDLMLDYYKKNDNLEDVFRCCLPRCASLLDTIHCTKKFFFTSAIVHEINENGHYVPPKHYSIAQHSFGGTLDSLKWLLRF